VTIALPGLTPASSHAWTPRAEALDEGHVRGQSMLGRDLLVGEDMQRFTFKTGSESECSEEFLVGVAVHQDFNPRSSSSAFSWYTLASSGVRPVI
jgi:hypothetical protein